MQTLAKIDEKLQFDDEKMCFSSIIEEKLTCFYGYC